MAVACTSSASRSPVFDVSTPDDGGVADGGVAEGGMAESGVADGAATCTAITPNEGDFFLDPIGEVSDCLRNSEGEVIPEADFISVLLDNTDPSKVRTVRFGGNGESCDATYDTCRLRSGCGVLVTYDHVGTPAVVSLDVSFSDADHFEGTIGFDVPSKGCKGTIEISGTAGL